MISALRRTCGIAVGLALLPTLCLATDVRIVAVTPGRSADVVIDEREPITIDVGRAIEGVQVVHVDRRGAVVKIDGVTKTLPLEAAGAAGRATSGSSITLEADARGHFSTAGAINDRPVRFLVDTGATLVALSVQDATRIGLDYRRGKPAVSMTANGPVRGWRVTVKSVRVGHVTVGDVECMVIDSPMQGALLGMSFLRRFEIEQRASTLVLRRSKR